MDITHRLANKTLRITDASGNVLANKKIHVLQKNHKFLFGCGAFESIPLTNGNGDEEWFPKIRKASDEWIRLFNYGTLPFYWGSYEPEEGEFFFDHGFGEIEIAVVARVISLTEEDGLGNQVHLIILIFL